MLESIGRYRNRAVEDVVRDLSLQVSFRFIVKRSEERTSYRASHLARIHPTNRSHRPSHSLLAVSPPVLDQSRERDQLESD